MLSSGVIRRTAHAYALHRRAILNGIKASISISRVFRANVFIGCYLWLACLFVRSGHEATASWVDFVSEAFKGITTF